MTPWESGGATWEVVESSIPACTLRPTAGRSRTTPKMSGIQFAAWDSDAKTNPDLLETSVGSILSCYVSSAEVLAHNCMGLLLVYSELPSSKYHYPLATMVANLAKLTPERPALIPRDDDRQAHELGLNNLGVRCQRASKAVVVMGKYVSGRQLCCLSIRTFRGALAMLQGSTHHTWSRIESPNSGNDNPFRQSWIPIVRANRARLMLSLCSVTGVKDPPAQAPGAHP
ncbi:hypothetical protein M405DRAFT_880378 [Rhizopogon salebrosus TDB-379]|nr:hypothetical protein M405DRAFT_880378 [Rhizopogon salebrosus TDB-379]